MAFHEHLAPTLQEAVEHVSEREARLETALGVPAEQRAAAIVYWLADSISAMDRVTRAVRENDLLIHPAYHEPAR